MLDLQKKEVDQESRKRMWLVRHRPTLRHVVDAEISEMCVVNINTWQQRYKIGLGFG